jgi:hypothetical protein
MYTIANQNFSYFFEVMVEHGPEKQFFKLREKKVNGSDSPRNTPI